MSRDPRGHDVPLGALWYALLGGPAAWTVHLLASYPLVPVACDMGTTALLNILTAVTALIGIGAAAAGWWAYRRVRGGEARGEAPGDSAFESRAGFMGITGLLLGVMFTFAIVLEGLPPLLQDPCLKGL